MADPPSYDEDLLKRLNALKKSHITLDTEADTPLPVAKSQSTPESSLADRLKSLRNVSSSVPSTGNSRTRTLNREIPTHSATVRFNASDVDLGNPDENIQALVSELEPSKDWKPETVDKKTMKSLMDEARNTLARGIRPSKETNLINHLIPSRKAKSQPENQSVRSFDDGPDDEHDGKENYSDEEEQESHEVAEIISSLLDEIDLERGSVYIESPTVPQADKHPSDQLDNSSSLHSASAPAYTPSTTLNPAAPLREIDPVPEPESDDEDEDEERHDRDTRVATRKTPARAAEEKAFYSSIEKRMAALRNLPTSTTPPPPSQPLLPSVPSSLPSLPSNPLSLPSVPRSKIGSSKTTPGVGKEWVFGRADEVRETWCVVCSDDAKVVCFDCDGKVDGDGEGVLYCARCWREGHLGEDVGREMRGHRWEMWRG